MGSVCLSTFCNGPLDPLESRDEFVDLGRRVSVPILFIYGAETPPKSQADMEALAALPGVRNVRLPRRKLSVHEEFPEATFAAIEPFLK